MRAGAPVCVLVCVFPSQPSWQLHNSSHWWIDMISHTSLHRLYFVWQRNFLVKKTINKNTNNTVSLVRYCCDFVFHKYNDIHCVSSWSNIHIMTNEFNNWQNCFKRFEIICETLSFSIFLIYGMNANNFAKQQIICSRCITCGNTGWRYVEIHCLVT